MKNPVKFLTLVLTQWNWAISQPQICKAILFPRRFTGADEFTCEVFRALLCHAGDWRAAAVWLDVKFPQFCERVTKFKRWAAKITAPQKRGLLLDWKGGEA